MAVAGHAFVTKCWAASERVSLVLDCSKRVAWNDLAVAKERRLWVDRETLSLPGRGES
jgi:hypothetical protein